MPLDLTGQKVRLRPLEERDLAALIEAYRDLDLQLTTDGDALPMSDIQVRAFWSDIMTDPGADLRYFAIEALSEAGHMVGACSLQHIDLRNRHAELSIFMIARDVRGMGYGTEAVRLLLRYGFDALRLDKVYLGVYDFNEGGIRAYEKNGFRYEGRHRQMLHYDGRAWDEWFMGILRAEWEASIQAPVDGLRPYHPDDFAAAVSLIQSIKQIDAAESRARLRHFWRRMDGTLYSYQINGVVMGLILRDEQGQLLDIVIDEPHREALLDFLKI